MKRIKQLIFSVFFGLAVSIVVYVASQTVLYRPFLKFQNMIDDSHFVRRFIISGTDDHITDKIVIVDIDDRSIKTQGIFKLWPRRHFAEVIGNLKNDGARLIFLDAILEGSSKGNKELADSIKTAGNVIAGYYFNLDARSKNHRPLDPVFNERFSTKWLSPQNLEKNEFIQAEEFVLPYYEFIKSTKSMGFTNYVPDPDGILRHIPLYITHDNLLYPSVSLQIWLTLKELRSSKVGISPSGIRFENTFIPTDKHCFMRLNFIAAGPVYKYVSFVDVLNGNFDAGTFRDKIVMIGSSSKKLGDLKRIPGYSALPGVEIHATALSTLLNEKFLTVLSGNIVFIITMLSGMLASVVFFLAPPFKLGMPVVLGVPLMFYIYSIRSFIVQSKLINILIPSFVIFLLYIVIVIHRLVEQYEKENCI